MIKDTKGKLFNHSKVKYASLIWTTRCNVFETPVSRGTHFRTRYWKNLTCMLFMLHYRFKYRENFNDYQYWFESEAMPRLSRQQREQAIGRLHAGQAARVIANDFNCSIRTIERLRQRFNATNSTNDRPRSGRPQVTTPRQNRYILRQHLNDRFAWASKQHDIPSERISDPSVMIQYVVGWDLTTSDVVVPTEVLSLHKDTVRHDSNGPYTSKTGGIDNGGM